jgi:hypothetical protein
VTIEEPTGEEFGERDASLPRPRTAIAISETANLR